MGRQYRNNYITSVIARLDYVSPVPELEPDVLSPSLKAAVSSRFPMAEREEVTFEVNLEGKALSQTKRTSTFYSQDRGKKLAIASDHFYLEVKRHAGYEALHDDFMAVATEVMGAHAVEGRRLGLRYVNRVEPGGLNPLAWSRYIDKRLLCSLKFSPSVGELARAFHQLAFNNEDWMLVLRFGLYNPDFPAAVRKKQFILDYDAYSERPVSLRDIGPLCDQFHSAIVKVFEQSITDALREKMGTVSDD